MSETGVAEVFTQLRPVLNGRQRRVLAGVTARALGRRGVAQVATLSGMSRKTVSTAVVEADRGLRRQLEFGSRALGARSWWK